VRDDGVLDLVGAAPVSWEVPNSISPSRMGLFLQCPLRFRIESMQKLPSGTNAAAVAGTTMHAALELLMAMPGPERTRSALADCVEVALVAIRDTADYQSLTPEQLKDFDAKCRRVTPRVFDMLEVPDVAVAGLELHLEVDLDGWTLRGIIDLLTGEAGALEVKDYKTGKTPSERFQSDAMLGLHFYSVMAEIEYGEVPREVALLYLESRTTISREPTERSNRAMRSKILAVRDAIAKACDRDDFRPSVGALCNWCNAKPYCPAHGGDPDAVPVAIGRTGLLGS
jgi:putative RecB family exonuclease